MKLFVINLRKNSERLAKISERLAKLGLTFERIDAVYGKDLSAHEKQRTVDRVHWWCVRGYAPRDGEIGCSLSHLIAYRRMVEESIPFACILEDDAVMDSRFVAQLDRVGATMSRDEPQVVLLSNYTATKEEEWKILPCVRDSSTEAYVINLAAAKKIVWKTPRVFLTADDWGYRVRHGWVNLFHAFPTVIIPEWRSDGGYSSDVTCATDHVVRAWEMGGLRRCIWKGTRMIGKILGKVVYHD